MAMFLGANKSEYESHECKVCLRMKHHTESTLSTNKEAISYATINFMESSIMA